MSGGIDFPDFDIDEASGAIDALPLSVEYPVVLFELLKDILAMEAGGFFLPDPLTGLYAPTALAGLDRTSAHRMRFPAEILSQACSGRAVALTREESTPLRMFFSSSDYRRLAALRIIPIPYGEAACAYLISVESRPWSIDKAVPMEWNMLKAFIGERLSIHAQRFGSSQLAGGGGAEGGAAALLELLKAATQRAQKSVYVVFSFLPLIEAITAKNPQADGYRLYSEAFAALSRMLAPPGSMLALPHFRIGMLISSQVKPDTELILHRMAGTLSRLFSSLDKVSLIPETSVDLNDSPQALQALLEKERLLG